jgi:hypothetical protein
MILALLISLAGSFQKGSTDTLAPHFVTVQDGLPALTTTFSEGI